jgi:hypothetical protein
MNGSPEAQSVRAGMASGATKARIGDLANGTEWNKMEQI